MDNKIQKNTAYEYGRHEYHKEEEKPEQPICLITVWMYTMIFGLAIIFAIPSWAIVGSLMEIYWLVYAGKFVMVATPAIMILTTVFCSTKGIFRSNSVSLALTLFAGYGLWLWWGESIKFAFSS